MKKRIVVVAVLAVLLAASAYAQPTDFFDLARTGSPHEVLAAIDKGVDVNARDAASATVLMWAAGMNPNPEMIVAFLKAGANIKIRDKDGATALMYAAATNSKPEVIATLLQAGDNINATDMSGTTALMLAASRNWNPEVIMALLKAGATTKVKDAHGMTAFNYAQDNKALTDTDALKGLIGVMTRQPLGRSCPRVRYT
ncbi:MAG: ankyrin repeat domain-containing protein [Spirochaetia bacterium]